MAKMRLCRDWCGQDEKCTANCQHNDARAAFRLAFGEPETRGPGMMRIQQQEPWPELPAADIMDAQRVMSRGLLPRQPGDVLVRRGFIRSSECEVRDGMLFGRFDFGDTTYSGPIANTHGLKYSDIRPLLGRAFGGEVELCTLGEAGHIVFRDPAADARSYAHYGAQVSVFAASSPPGVTFQSIIGRMHRELAAKAQRTATAKLTRIAERSRDTMKRGAARVELMARMAPAPLPAMRDDWDQLPDAEPGGIVRRP